MIITLVAATDVKVGDTLYNRANDSGDIVVEVRSRGARGLILNAGAATREVMPFQLVEIVR